MRKFLLISLLGLTALGFATIKDPRQHVKLNPELSQEVVARQQALQHQQGQIGGVPQKSDDSGYLPRAESDGDAAVLVAAHDQNAGDSGEQVIAKNSDAMTSESEKPRKQAFGALWALLIGGVLALGVWAGLHKYGPKPPDHVK